MFKRYATAQGRQSWTCTGLRASRPPDSRDDLREVVHVAAPLVLRDVPHDEHSLRDLREASRARDRRLVQDRLADDEPDSDRTHDAGRRRPCPATWRLTRPSGGGKTRAGDSREGRQHVIAKMSRRPTIWAAVERGGRVKLRSSSRAGPRYRRSDLRVRPTLVDDLHRRVGATRTASASRYIAHRRIRHEDRVYVSGNVHTQTDRGFFGNLKNGIRGTYHSVSSKWLQGYLNEYAFRYNERSTTSARCSTRC